MNTESRRNRLARLLAPAGLIVVLAGLVGCPLVRTTGLFIVNRSNVEVHAVYVSPVADRIEPDYLDHDDWGPNLVEGQTDLGYGTVIAVTGIPNGTYDILVVATYTPQYGGDLARFIQWGAVLDGGFYEWELLPAKGDGTGGEAESLFERIGALPPSGLAPNVSVDLGE